MRRCAIADGNCDIDAPYVCYRCGNGVCGECSAIRPYKTYRVQGGWKERPHRICADCWDEEQAWEKRKEKGK